MSKKRPLSPGASSHSSATPGQSGPRDSPALNGSAVDGPLAAEHPIAGPSRLSSSATPAPAPIISPQTYAKHGNIVAGSGDGSAFGEECFSWDGLPMNKGAYRYVPCAASPNPSPNPLVPFYRTIPYGPELTPVHISFVDRSPFLRLSPSAMSASTDRGYRSARANVAVREGSWYYEVVIERGNGATGAGRGSAGVGMQDGNAHVRVGWGRREASLEMPVGADGYSYAIRDVGGEKVTLSRPKAYGRAFARGDVIGCMITLPPRPPPPIHDDHDPAIIKRRRAPLNYKGQHYLEMNEYLPSKEMETLIDREGKLAAAAKAATDAAHAPVANGESGAKVNKKKATTKNTKKGNAAPAEDTVTKSRPLHGLPGSRIEFYLNGEPLGAAFENLYDFIPLPPLFPPASTRKHGHHPFDPQRDVLHDDGTLGYFPMVSCFGRGKVRVNFGPTWLRPPSSLEARPMVERWEEFREEERALDERDEEVLAERLRKDMAEESRRQALWEAKALKMGAKKVPSGKLKGKKAGGTSRNTPNGSLKGTPVPSTASSPAPATPGEIEDRESPVKVERASEAPVSERKSKSESKSRSRAGSVRSSTHGHDGMDVDAPGEADPDAGADADGEEDQGIAWDPA